MGRTVCVFSGPLFLMLVGFPVLQGGHIKSKFVFTSSYFLFYVLENILTFKYLRK